MELVLRLIYEEMCNAACQCSATGSQTILLESLTEQAGGKGGALVPKRADGNPDIASRGHRLDRQRLLHHRRISGADEPLETERFLSITTD